MRLKAKYPSAVVCLDAHADQAAQLLDKLQGRRRSARVPARGARSLGAPRLPHGPMALAAGVCRSSRLVAGALCRAELKSTGVEAFKAKYTTRGACLRANAAKAAGIVKDAGRVPARPDGPVRARRCEALGLPAHGPRRGGLGEHGCVARPRWQIAASSVTIGSLSGSRPCIWAPVAPWRCSVPPNRSSRLETADGATVDQAKGGAMRIDLADRVALTSCCSAVWAAAAARRVLNGGPSVSGMLPRCRARRRTEPPELVDAGREVFAEQGPDAPLEEIARRAGVGIGTLYRHFPTREALVEAIYAEHIGEVRRGGRGGGRRGGRLGRAGRLPRAGARAPGPEPAAAGRLPAPAGRTRIVAERRRQIRPLLEAAGRPRPRAGGAARRLHARRPLARDVVVRADLRGDRRGRTGRLAPPPADPARRDAARGRDAPGGRARSPSRSSRRAIDALRNRYHRRRAAA